MDQFKLFDVYRRQNVQDRSADFCDIDYLLRVWKENKSQYLMKLFNGELILEKSVVYNQAKDELINNMSDFVYRYSYAIEKIVGKLGDVFGVDDMTDISYYNKEYCVWKRIRNSLYSPAVLIDNTLDLSYYYDKDDNRISIKSYTIDFKNGNKVHLQNGMKFTRAMGQICKNLGMEAEWEKMRINHSQVLNTKTLKGTLCLSIHPLDYATASDNDNGWSSCMSWREEGCYRMGTIEMMNSPMVICAYLKSDKQNLTIDGEKWNSKKWRAWIIVNKDVIVCNRHYPYHQSDLAKMCIEWVRELVKDHFSWTYNKTYEDFYDYMSGIDHEIEFVTNYMYNDMGGSDIIGCLNPKSKTYTINFSGPAECMVCGRTIAPDSDNQSSGAIECSDCDVHTICDCCGCNIYDDDDVRTDPNGNPICLDCFDRLCSYCESCDGVMWNEETYNASLPLMPEIVEKYKKIFDEGSFMYDYICHNRNTDPVKMCSDCAQTMDLESWKIKNKGFSWCINVPNPNIVSKEDILRSLNCEYYRDAEFINRTGEIAFFHTAGDKNYYEEILNFWNENFEAFKKAFNDDSEEC